MSKTKKSKIKILLLLSAIAAGFSGFFSMLIRKRKKEVVFKGEKKSLYPQDVFLGKTLLKLIPNFITPTYITISRIILTPFIAYAILKLDNVFIVISLFLAVSFTDMIDGALARTRNQITDLGKALDPVADKLLFISCAILLLPKYESTNILVAIIFLEIITMITTGLIMGKGDIGANIFGKIKLNLQLFGLLIFILIDHNYFNNSITLLCAKLILSISIVLGIISYFITLKKNKKTV